MNKALIAGLSLAVAFTSSAALAGGDAAAGRAKSAVCAGCHGADGNSMVPTYPKLAGQHATYIQNALKAYKSGGRSDPTMKSMAAPLSDADIANLAAYFSSQKAK